MLLEVRLEFGQQALDLRRLEFLGLQRSPLQLQQLHLSGDLFPRVVFHLLDKGGQEGVGLFIAEGGPLVQMLKLGQRGQDVIFLVRRLVGEDAGAWREIAWPSSREVRPLELNRPRLFGDSFNCVRLAA